NHDVIDLGDGEDRVNLLDTSFSTMNFAVLDGGNSYDTLVLKGVGITDFDLRDFNRAAIHQRAFVASQPQNAGRAWGFLGDILLARGDKQGARVAYQRAIQEMLRSLAPM
ncbi:MAG: hypothetical protein EBY09_12145, partial [Verrucomicrobia bacterium]|nr:hypothetical protein [Verrucomicrobiota bacterium]